MEHTERHELILIMGSNTEQGRYIADAQRMLETLFGDITFTECLWTDAIGMDGPQFLNCAARATTTLPVEETLAELKSIERTLGSTKEARQQGIVTIDIDLLQHGTTRLHEDDRQRDYVKQLMEQLRWSER